MKTWVHIEKRDSEELTNTDLIGLTSDRNYEEESENSEDEEQGPNILHQEGMESLHKAMLYVEQQSERSYSSRCSFN